MADNHSEARSKKQLDLLRSMQSAEGARLTTDQGVAIPDTDNSLRPGPRGPSLLEDFHLREKLTRFDHERIPERVVHARGSAAHGFFQVYESLEHLTTAKFLHDPRRQTPVFVRFSTVAGSRGSADTVRDVRGFATKFYTDEGNFDLVGNNIPVFFIQDGIKFPDVVHAVKPEAPNEMPSAASAHDTFWDFVSLVPETTHMLMWAMSDRAIPRSYRMMEGFGVHTFRLVNARNHGCLVKFHWKPLLGVHGLTWDEAQKIAGFDPDFHRRDLWDTIATGNVVEYELGLQMVPEADEHNLGIDLLDPTKLIPEEQVPVQRVGKMTLNRNPANFFAETEQVAYCVANLVPGIDVTDDPLMQARLFSYLDTQLSRLGSPNFAELPINRPVTPVSNHQQDGHMRHGIPTELANYHPNSVGGGCPVLASMQEGYVHFPEPVQGVKRRQRSKTFADYTTQATLFYRSLSPVEQLHIRNAFSFELGKVTRVPIRERMVQTLVRVDTDLANAVVQAIGVAMPKESSKPASHLKPSPALRMITDTPAPVATRKVACLCAPGVAVAHIKALRDVLIQRGAILELVAPSLGPLGSDCVTDKALIAAPSVLYDAIFIPDGQASAQALQAHPALRTFLTDAFMHAKTVGACGAGAQLLRSVVPQAAGAPGVLEDQADAIHQVVENFVAAMAKHRHWGRAGIM